MSPRGGRTKRVEARITLAQHEAYKRAAKQPRDALPNGYPSVAEWITATLDREVEVLDWTEHGLDDDDPTDHLSQEGEPPDVREAADRAPSTLVPESDP